METYSQNDSKGIKKFMLITILVAVILVTGIWVWKEIQQDKIEERAKELQVQSQERQLMLLAKPFVWAVRTEMLQGNMKQVYLYLNEMVKEKNFQRIVIADNKGVIVASTDKKMEGKQFQTVGQTSYLSNNSTLVNKTSDSILVMSTPIMGLNNRIGTLMVTYKIEKSKF